MNWQEMVQLTDEIVRKYYNNDIQPFLDHVDERVLWYGPAKGQFLSGKSALIDAWANEKHSLTFTLGNIRLDHISTNDTYCEVMMSFPVTTHFPDGQHITMDQIIHISWCERKIKGVEDKVPRMLVVHISDLYHKHEEDNIYPVHFNQIYRGYMPVSDSGKRIYFRGMDSSSLYLFSDSIIWAESSTYGRRSVLHTNDGSFRVSDSPDELEEKYPDVLLRCHLQYLVNPIHIQRIYRFKVVMPDGKELPIPEKKYTAFKRAVKEFMDMLEEEKHDKKE